MKTYSNQDNWKRVQYFYPERMRINRSNYPKEEIWDRKNMKVHIDRYVPVKTPKDVKVLLVHGGGGNGRLMFPFGVSLVNRGYECVSPDMPGFGLTTYKNTIDYQDWINLLVDLIDKEHKKDQKPIVIIGISLGGMLAYQVACLSNYVSGLIVTALLDTTTSESKKILAKNDIIATIGNTVVEKLAGFVDNIKVPIGELTPMDKMANNEDYIYLLKKSKIASGSWVPIKWIRTMQTTSAAIEPEHFDKAPLLFLHPEEDQLLSFEDSKAFFDKLNCPKNLVYLKNCGHIPLEEPGITQMEEEILLFLSKIN